MSVCRVFSCVVGRECLSWPLHCLGKTLLAFALLHSVLQGRICLLLQVFSWLPTFAFQSPWNKRISFYGVSSRRSCRSSKNQSALASLASGWLRWYRICLQCRRPGFNPWVGKIPWRQEWLPTPVFSPGASHGQRSLVGYSPWGCEQSETILQLNHHDHVCLC